MIEACNSIFRWRKTIKRSPAWRDSMYSCLLYVLLHSPDGLWASHLLASKFRTSFSLSALICCQFKARYLLMVLSLFVYKMGISCLWVCFNVFFLSSVFVFSGWQRSEREQLRSQRRSVSLSRTQRKHTVNTHLFTTFHSPSYMFEITFMIEKYALNYLRLDMFSGKKSHWVSIHLSVN